MHGHTYIKFACAKQAKDAHAYKNTKRTLYIRTPEDGHVNVRNM